MVIGIIGKVGSGKSTCVEYIERAYGAIVFSCDSIAKDIIENKETDYIALPSGLFFRSEEAQEECRNKIHKLVFDRISIQIMNITKNLNIKNNENIVKVKNKNNFLEHNESNEGERNKSNANNRILENKNYLTNNYSQIDKKDILIVIECALPSERLFEMCDKVIYIRNSYEDKVKLLYEKRAYTEDVTKLIYDSQAYYDKFYNRANIIVENNGTKEDLEKKIKEVIDEIYIVRK